MAITDTAIHEVDAMRWLLDDEYVSAQVIYPKKTSKASQHLHDPQIVLLETATEQIEGTAWSAQDAKRRKARTEATMFTERLVPSLFLQESSLTNTPRLGRTGGLPDHRNITHPLFGRTIVNSERVRAVHLDVHFMGKVEINDVRSGNAAETRSYGCRAR
jgi:predicted dehydrogenase